MSNRAWMPLHIDDYLADTGHLTGAEHGAYMLMIMHYWQNGALPENERLIARIARMDATQWEESRDVLAMLFGPGWTHKRIDAELAKADEIIEKRRSAANGRHAKSKSDAHAVQVQSKCSDTGALPLTDNLNPDTSVSGETADPREILWSHGVAYIRTKTGKTEAAAKSIIGKWLKDASDDCALVLSKVRKARSEKIGEPIAWITAALKPPDKATSKPRNAGEFSRMQLKAMSEANAPDYETRHIIQGDRIADHPSTGIARQFAITAGR
jgi:uncharacterized protein YdaU (DUF1376 family)